MTSLVKVGRSPVADNLLLGLGGTLCTGALTILRGSGALDLSSVLLVGEGCSAAPLKE
jgi:hypothetical protein